MNGNATITELRKQGLSYQAIATQCGLSCQRVHQLFSGYKPPGNRNISLQLAYKAVRERDNYKCQRCGCTGTLVVHHQDGNDTNNIESNLICLCSACHSTLHRPVRPPKPPILQTHHPKANQPRLEPIRVMGIYGVSESATALGISYVTLYRWIKAGKLLPIRIAGRTLIPKSEVVRLQGENKK